MAKGDNMTTIQQTLNTLNGKTDWDAVRAIVNDMTPRLRAALANTDGVKFTVEPPGAGFEALGRITAYIPYTKAHEKKRRAHCVDMYPSRVQLTDLDREMIGEVFGRAIRGMDDINIYRVSLRKTTLPVGFVAYRYGPKEFPRKS